MNTNDLMNQSQRRSTRSTARSAVAMASGNQDEMSDSDSALITQIRQIFHNEIASVKDEIRSMRSDITQAVVVATSAMNFAKQASDTV